MMIKIQKNVMSSEVETSAITFQTDSSAAVGMTRCKIQNLSPFGGGRGRFKDSRFKVQGSMIQGSRFNDSRFKVQGSMIQKLKNW